MQYAYTADDVHRLLDQMIGYAKDWNIANFKYTDLIVQDNNEYECLKNFRLLRDSCNKQFTLDMVNRMTIEKKSIKKKHFWQ